MADEKMMDTLQVVLPAPANERRAYNIWLGSGLLHSVGRLLECDRYSRLAIVTDSNVRPHWAEILCRALPRPAEVIELPPGETHKTLHTIQEIWKRLLQSGADRRSLVLNLGGGVIGDMGGFAAGTYMRGIDFLQIPTTLLAQVDASVGGKVGIDFGGVKNLVGTFTQPVGVVIDTDTLQTLPKRQLNSAFAEIIKHGLIADRKYFETAAALDGPPAAGQLAAIVKGSCEIKVSIVQADEKEAGPRKTLNFGHTLGHAVEALMLSRPDPWLHGEAVAVGMAGEAWLSHRLGLLSAGELARIEAALRRFELPVRIPVPLPYEELLRLMTADKKNNAGAINWTLLKGIGAAVYDQRVDESLLREMLGAVTQG